MAITHDQLQAAYAYLRSIRNPAKHKYAHALILHTLATDQHPRPSRGALGVMGAQAVEMQLAEIFRPITATPRPFYPKATP